MKVVIQRSKAASVAVDGEVIGSIEHGLVLLVGIGPQDTESDVSWMADKVTGLRIFEDETGKMNLSIREANGEILSISQFTLYGDCRKGRRPSFTGAAKPDHAEALYAMFNRMLRDRGLLVATGRFGAMMEVELINSGPVTLIVDSKE